MLTISSRKTSRWNSTWRTAQKVGKSHYALLSINLSWVSYHFCSYTRAFGGGLDTYFQLVTLEWLICVFDAPEPNQGGHWDFCILPHWLFSSGTHKARAQLGIQKVITTREHVFLNVVWLLYVHFVLFNSPQLNLSSRARSRRRKRTRAAIIAAKRSELKPHKCITKRALTVALMNKYKSRLTG